jgi:hypothetical protein
MHNERGSIIIHVAIALVALLAFAGIVIDYGVMWTARGQSQNAADAGVLAAGETLLQNATDLANATIMAKSFANQNAVWGTSAGNANIDVSSFPIECPDHSLACVRVDVMRGIRGRDGAAHTNVIPTFLIRMFGPSTQGVRATATAQIASALNVQCIKPWAVADKWTDNSATGVNKTGWDQEDVFNPPTDVYTAPGFKATGPNNDYGLEVMLKGDDDWAAAWSMEIDLNGGGGSPPYEAEIGGCPTWVPTVGVYNPSTGPCNGGGDVDPALGCLSVKTGVRTGPTDKGVKTLVDRDPSATWNSTTNSVDGGCTASKNCYSVNPARLDVSPRIVPIAMFNPQAYHDQGGNGTNGEIQVVNLLGFFVEGMCDDVYPNAATRPTWCGKNNAAAKKTVVGRLVNYPGQGSTHAEAAVAGSFAKFVRLVK